MNIFEIIKPNRSKLPLFSVMGQIHSHAQFPETLINSYSIVFQILQQVIMQGHAIQYYYLYIKQTLIFQEPSEEREN